MGGAILIGMGALIRGPVSDIEECLLCHSLPTSLEVKKVVSMLLQCLFLNTKEKIGNISLGLN